MRLVSTTAKQCCLPGCTSAAEPGSGSKHGGVRRACCLQHYQAWKRGSSSLLSPSAVLSNSTSAARPPPFKRSRFQRAIAHDEPEVPTESLQTSVSHGSEATPSLAPTTAVLPAPPSTSAVTQRCTRCSHRIGCSTCGCPKCAADKGAPWTAVVGTLCDSARRRGARCGDSDTHSCSERPVPQSPLVSTTGDAAPTDPGPFGIPPSCAIRVSPRADPKF